MLTVITNCPFQCISPEVIILRVATGRAVSTRRETHGKAGGVGTVMKFRTPQVDTLGLVTITPQGGTNVTGTTALGSTPTLLKDDV